MVNKIKAGKRLVIERKNVSKEHLDGQIVSDFVSIESTFSDCSFQNMQIAQASFGSGLRRSVYKNCLFDGSQIRASSPGIARFEECSFRNTRFLELNCRNVEFVRCTFTGEISKGFFNGSSQANGQLTKLEFYDNDFSQCKLMDVAFRSGIDLKSQKLPVASEYIIIENVSALLNYFKSNSSVVNQFKKECEVISKILEIDLAKGQTKAFLSMSGFPSKFRRALEYIKGLNL